MRNEDYDRELLAIVTSFCVLVAVALGVFDTSPSVARTAPAASTAVAQPTVTPVRVVGTPFVPNTDPSRR